MSLRAEKVSKLFDGLVENILPFNIIATS